MHDDRPILDYAPPPERPRWVSHLSKLCGRVSIYLLLLLAAVLMPHPEGIWYVGHRPQWVIAIEYFDLMIGPQTDAVHLGPIPLFVTRMLVIALPVWIGFKFLVHPAHRIGGSMPHDVYTARQP